MRVSVKVEKVFDSFNAFMYAFDDAKIEPYLVDAAKIIAAEAERLAPIRRLDYPRSRMKGRGWANQDRSRGRLRRSMRAVLWKRRALGPTAIAAQDVRKEDTYYARWVNRGTKPHTIGKGSRRRSGRQLGREHPGTRATFFFRDAVNSSRYRARKIIEAGLKACVDTIPTR